MTMKAWIVWVGTKPLVHFGTEEETTESVSLLFHHEQGVEELPLGDGYHTAVLHVIDLDKEANP